MDYKLIKSSNNDIEKLIDYKKKQFLNMLKIYQKMKLIR